jgi:TPP-dependent pyruvate/acetoin dehydrogenase alpha subunit
MGRKTSVTRGKEANMHMGDMRRNIVAFCQHAGRHNPRSCGCGADV